LFDAENVDVVLVGLGKKTVEKQIIGSLYSRLLLCS
jgi:hypothetical protein